MKIDPMKWMLRNNASLVRGEWLGGRFVWRVTVPTGHGAIGTGDTPQAALDSAVERWGYKSEDMVSDVTDRPQGRTSAQGLRDAFRFAEDSRRDKDRD